MCGICGVVASRREPEELARIGASMLEAVAHRGPDGRAVEVLGPPRAPRGLVLAQARLAVIDLSPAGRQPMWSADRSLGIVYNGEIYNFRALRQELEQAGRTFRSGTDTEVLLQLYEAHGPAFVRRLEGMFAFALCDLRNGTLLLARDPLGVKPLYYHARPELFLFGSEIKAILASGLYTPELDRQALHDFFTFLYVPWPATLFAGIRQLPPAHLLTVSLADGSTTLERYWQVRRLPEVERASRGELIELLRARLGESVRDQLVSDVPLGVFLSGGIDSSIVTGLARRHLAQLQTYTLTFEGDELAFYDERALARAAARHLGTEHHELPIGPPDPLELLEMAAHFDQPFGNPTYYLMQRISARARERITVALCGAGGDELFAGYPRYRAAALARRIAWMPRSLLRLSGQGLGVFRDSYRTMRLRRAREFLAGLDADPVRQFTRWTYHLDEDDKRELLGPADAATAPSERRLGALLAASPLHDPGNRLLHLDVQSFLVDNLLAYTDIMASSVALEVRVPLLDHRFVELALNVPFAYKLAGGSGKRIFREAFAELLAPELASAPKRGFNVPLARWMLGPLDAYFEASQQPRHPLRARLGEDVGRTWRDGLLSWPAICKLRGQLGSGRADTSYELFAILLVDLWWRRHLEPAPAAAR